MHCLRMMADCCSLQCPVKCLHFDDTLFSWMNISIVKRLILLYSMNQRFDDAAMQLQHWCPNLIIESWMNTTDATFWLKEHHTRPQFDNTVSTQYYKCKEVGDEILNEPHKTVTCFITQHWLNITQFPKDWLLHEHYTSAKCLMVLRWINITMAKSSATRHTYRPLLH